MTPRPRSDDTNIGIWNYVTDATITVEEGFISYPTLANFTGDTIFTSGAAPNDYYAISMSQLYSMNHTVVPVLIRMPSRDDMGHVRTLGFVLYRVQLNTFELTGPVYKTGCSWTGRAKEYAADELLAIDRFPFRSRARPALSGPTIPPPALSTPRPASTPWRLGPCAVIAAALSACRAPRCGRSPRIPPIGLACRNLNPALRER